MATTSTDANTAAAADRATGQTTLNPQVLTTIHNHYRGAVALGISINRARAGPLAADALTPARHSRPHADMILRFVVDLAMPFTNYADIGIRTTTKQKETSDLSKSNNGLPAAPDTP